MEPNTVLVLRLLLRKISLHWRMDCMLLLNSMGLRQFNITIHRASRSLHSIHNGISPIWHIIVSRIRDDSGWFGIVRQFYHPCGYITLVRCLRGTPKRIIRHGISE